MSDWKQRREASRQAAAWLDTVLPRPRPKSKIYRMYERLSASDDPYLATVASEIMSALDARDTLRAVHARNEYCRFVKWLPNRRVATMWPIAVPLTWEQSLVLSYHADNVIFIDDQGLCFGFEVDDRDYFDFLNCRRHHGNAT